MQKFKKAIKKLAGIVDKPSAASAGSARPGKKQPPTKKKTHVQASAHKPASAKAAAAPSGKKAGGAAHAGKKAPVVVVTKKVPLKTKSPLEAKAELKSEAKSDPNKKKLGPSAGASEPTVVPSTQFSSAAAKPHVSAKGVTTRIVTKKAQSELQSAKSAPAVVAKVQKKPGDRLADTDATDSHTEGPSTKGKVKKERTEVENPGDVTAVVSATTEEEVHLTDAEGRRYCRVKDCDQAAAVGGGYCRFHYLLFWKNIQNRKKILSEGKLERYIEELTARYPDKYLELLRKDLRSEKDFSAAIQELEIDESGVDNEFEDEAQNYLDEVRGMSSESQPEREEDF